MLIHITPRYFNKYSDIDLELIDVLIPELSLTLQSGKDLAVRTPHRNKCFKVVCKKKGNRAINGIFIESDVFINHFTVISRWVVNGVISTHITHYEVADNDFDAVTSEMFLWNSFYNTPYNFRNKTSKDIDLFNQNQSTMVSLHTDYKNNVEDAAVINDMDSQDLVRLRTEFVRIPTVERERLTVDFFGNDGLPTYDCTFHATSAPCDLSLIPGKTRELGVLSINIIDWITELVNEGEEDYCLRVLDDIQKVTSSFFTNTNHLIVLAKQFSPSYRLLSIHEKQHLENVFSQPIFHVFIEQLEETC